jgi:hypothetical protein
MSETSTDGTAADGDELRERVTKAAELLGWGQGSVNRFARALTGKTWEECGEEELREMLDEYEVLIDVVEAKKARSGGVSPCS